MTGRTKLFFGAALAALCQGAPALAQDDSEDVIVVTGTRIQSPGVVSASPVDSVDAEEIARQQQPELERVIRVLPMTIPGDGQNVNNGTAGAATLNLRGLGPQRNLIMMDGQRVTPFGPAGTVDTQVIPTALVERIDIITGGASATYGSDAMSGAVNMVLRRDFEGVDFTYNRSITGEGDGEINSAFLTLGANIADGRGNVAVSLNYANRDGVQLGARPLGRLGIATEDGSGYAEFLAGQPPTPPPPGCGGENSVASGGSTTTLPTRVAIAGGPGLGQFRDDGTIGANCSVFNFNPYNYYQTPQERFGGSALGHFDITENLEAYARFSFTKTQVTQQIAPSGIFGDTFWTPLSNPLIGAAAQSTIITTGEAGRVAGTVLTGGAFPNWRDLNSNGIVDAADDLLISYRRRTVELGPRSASFTADWFQVVAGVRGDFNDDVHYDLNISHGESDRVAVNRGYSNLSHISDQVYSLDGTTCALSSDPSCVPINLFGGQGTITPEAAEYARATGILQFGYSQTVATGVINGDLPFQSPWAQTPVAFSFGGEYREEEGFAEPDECLKLAPASCLGGFGGNILPIRGGFNATELFGEAIIPLLEGQPFAESLALELGYRTADFEPSGEVETWKYGLSWEPVEGLRFRAMQQRAARAPNVGEIGSPVTTGLDNVEGIGDPCSIDNAANIDATLHALCLSTGMTAAQVGTVENVVSGQINIFAGSNPLALPGPESADTTTIGFVLTPDLGDVLLRPTLTVDYYDIKINDYINAPPAQAILDGCYVSGDAGQCALIQRVGGTLTLPGSGLEAFITNLDFLQAEGVEIGAQFGVDLGNLGTLRFIFNGNHYITNEFQSDPISGVTNCKGMFSAACGGNFGSPLPENRWIQRSLWEIGDFEFSYLWRHLGEVESSIDPAAIFPAFRTIEAFDYIDLNAAWQVNDNARLMISVTNVTEQDPPVVGNEAGDTANNSGNTFPSFYDPLGRVWAVGFNVRF